MAASVAARPYQIVVWGATGFTGRLVCEHIANDYQGKVRWAMAGRDRRKLESVKEQLVRLNPACKDVPIILADSGDQASVLQMAQQTQVVLSTAGPFLKYGSPVVAASVEAGTHYCDITGEVPWVKRMRVQHHEAAAAKGVKLVHCCGFDSVPSDLGTLLVTDHIKTRLGKKCDRVINDMGKMSGTLSGGTLASGQAMNELMPAEELQFWDRDQYYLVTERSRVGSDVPAPNQAVYSNHAGAYLVPFIMGRINSRVVHLSNSLLPGGGYGTDFKYWEAQAVSNPVTAWLMVLVGRLLGAALGTPLVGLMKRLKVLPSPGEGPSRVAMMQKGYWWSHLVGVTEEPQGASPQIVHAVVGDPKRDPGYWSTSRMVLEAALCLALQQDELAAAGYPSGGSLTPATALGLVLIQRLKGAGFRFDITESPALAASSGAAAPSAGAAVAASK